MGRGEAYPEPVVLKVSASAGFGDVDVGVCGHAFWLYSEDGAVGDLEIGALCATNAGVNVPDARAALGVQVVLDEYSARCRSLGGHKHV